MPIYKGSEKEGRGRDNGVEARPLKRDTIFEDISRFISTLPYAGAAVHVGLGDDWDRSHGVCVGQAATALAGALGKRRVKRRGFCLTWGLPWVYFCSSIPDSGHDSVRFLD